MYSLLDFQGSVSCVDGAIFGKVTQIVRNKEERTRMSLIRRTMASASSAVCPSGKAGELGPLRS